LRSSIVVLLGVLVVGSIVISFGFITNQEIVEISEISTQYEKLEKYKIELEKINQFNLEMLQDLESQIKNSDNIHLEQITEEIFTYDTTVFVKEVSSDEESTDSTLAIIPILIVIGVGIYVIRRRKKAAIKTNN